METWREIIIQNLGTSAVQINNAIYLMPKQCLRITASSPSEIQLTSQTPTLLSEEIEFTEIPTVAYTITITNNQANPTPSTFQQLLNLNLSSILSSSSQLLNLQFCLDINCNTPLYAWIESYNSNLSTVYIWIKLPTSIPANSSITIYIFIRNSIQYPYTGIAPYFTSTYAQYDNGENVFTFYDNFAGTTLKSVWVVPSGSNYQVNNGFIAEPSSSTAVYNPNVQETSSIIAEWALNMSSTSYPGTNVYFQLNRYTPYSNMHMLGVSGSDALYNNNTQINVVSISSSGIQIFGIWNGGTTVTWYYEGNSYTNNSVTAETDYLALGWAYNAQSYNFPTIYWVRTRAYPPNGVMPTNSQPQKTIILIA